MVAAVKALAEQTAKATSDTPTVSPRSGRHQRGRRSDPELAPSAASTRPRWRSRQRGAAGCRDPEIARSIEAVTVNAASMTRSMEQVQGAVEATTGSAAEVKRTTQALSVDTGILSTEVQDFLASLRDLGESRQLRTLEVDLSATAIVDGKSVAGRVRKVSPGLALFDGPLQVAMGTLVELRVEKLDRPLRGRFVERIADGCQIQLLLNHEHLSFMEGAMSRLAAAA